MHKTSAGARGWYCTSPMAAKEKRFPPLCRSFGRLLRQRNLGKGKNRRRSGAMVEKKRRGVFARLGEIWKSQLEGISETRGELVSWVRWAREWIPLRWEGHPRPAESHPFGARSWT